MVIVLLLPPTFLMAKNLYFYFAKKTFTKDSVVLKMHILVLSGSSKIGLYLEELGK